MAEANCVSVKALHVYEEKGILRPAAVSPETGYRSYSIMQSTKLDMIVQLQAAGFSLSDIEDIARRRDVEYLRDRAQGRSRAIAEEIERLRIMQSISDELVEDCNRYMTRGTCGVMRLELVPDRRVLLLDTPTDADLGGDEDYTDNERWEWYQRHAKRCIVDRGYPLNLFRSVGCYVPLAQVAPVMDLLHSAPMVFVGPAFRGLYEQAMLLEGGPCVTVYFDVCHADDGSNIDDGRLAEMFTFMDRAGYEPRGPFTVENIFRYMRFFNEDAHSYYRYCLPVRLK